MTATFVRMRTVFVFFGLALTAIYLLNAPAAMAQVTSSTGSIQGTIVDHQGGAVTSAKVTITNKSTGQTLNAPVNEAGVYVAGSL